MSKATNNTADVDDFVTATVAARYAGVTPSHARQLACDGLVLARKFGPMWQISKSDLRRYLSKVVSRRPRVSEKRKKKP